MSANSPWTIDQLDEMIATAERTGDTGNLGMLRHYREQAEQDEQSRTDPEEYLAELRENAKRDRIGWRL